MSDGPISHELRLHRHRLDPGGRSLDLAAATRVVYVVDGLVTLQCDDRPRQLGTNEAAHATSPVSLEAVDSPASVLRWDLVPADVPSGDDVVLTGGIALDPDGEYLIRCDRVDFPPEGVALLHTHQGPGIRCLLHGYLRVLVDGDDTGHEPMSAWFERGPDPVYAAASEREPSAFARVMVLPRELLGRSSISYVREEDRDVPKSQRYTVFVDEPIDVPGRGGS